MCHVQSNGQREVPMNACERESFIPLSLVDPNFTPLHDRCKCIDLIQSKEHRILRWLAGFLGDSLNIPNETIFGSSWFHRMSSYRASIASSMYYIYHYLDVSNAAYKTGISPYVSSMHKYNMYMNFSLCKFALGYICMCNFIVKCIGFTCMSIYSYISVSRVFFWHIYVCIYVCVLL